MLKFVEKIFLLYYNEYTTTKTTYINDFTFKSNQSFEYLNRQKTNKVKYVT